MEPLYKYEVVTATSRRTEVACQRCADRHRGILEGRAVMAAVGEPFRMIGPVGTGRCSRCAWRERDNAHSELIGRRR